MSLGTVEDPLAKVPASFSSREFTMKNILSAVNVGSLLAANMASFNTRDFTLVKGLRCASRCSYF